jgi:flagellar motility protein MotE (MotC chaperone)
MNKFKILLASVVMLSPLNINSVFASDEKPATAVVAVTPAVKGKSENEDRQKYQNVIDEYKKYLQTVPKSLRDEIKNFRTEMVRLNTEKRETYKKLSNEAQEFLKKERECKKKLPIRMRKDFYQESNNELNSADSKKQ